MEKYDKKAYIAMMQERIQSYRLTGLRLRLADVQSYRYYSFVRAYAIRSEIERLERNS